MADPIRQTTRPDIVARLRDPSLGSPRWADTMAEAADKIEELRRAAVAAAMPLQAMMLGGTWRMHTPDVQAAIKDGVVAVREAIADV